MNPSQTQAQEHASADRYTQRYADDPLKCRLLMCLCCARHSKSIAQLAEPLHVHPSQVCKSLRMLVLDGLACERGIPARKRIHSPTIRQPAGL